MRLALLVALHLVLQPVLAAAAAEPVAVVPWFTDAQIDGGVRGLRSPQALPWAPGTFGRGVRLAQAFPIENPLLSQKRGYISFWLRPDWDGNDGKTHRILRIGDPERNGLLVEKSDKNLLRFVMASPKKVSASRADVSHWKAGEWHHIVVVWMDREDRPLGMPLWIDRVAVAGPVTADNDFLNPQTMTDGRVWIGDRSSGAVMDELIMRRNLRTKLSDSQIRLVYRDYFRTAPYSAIRIDPEPCRVPSDRRVVKGHTKQFGLEGNLGGRAEDMTDFTARYGCWGDFDAKPFIRWETSDTRIATVDENGLVTGKLAGRCTLMATYRGMSATYNIEVIAAEQPDLTIAYVERLPRYAAERLKNNPAPGEQVESVVHVFNMGFRPVLAGTAVVLELFPDSNGNFRIDPEEERLARYQTQRLDALKPKEEAVVRFPWIWPAEPVWVRVTVDPRNQVPEICEANNRRWSLNTARPVRWGYMAEEKERYYDEKIINLVGSFCTFDWAQAQVLRAELMLRDAVYPSTSPDGVRDSIRLDMILKKSEMLAGEGRFKDLEKKEEHENKWWDGGWPNHEINHPMMLDSGVIHELGHVMLALPDLYGYPMQPHRVYLKDENGKLYEGGELMPYIYRYKLLPRSRAAGFVPCGEGYSSLMDGCHLWLDESNAGKIQHYAGFRGHQFWGSQGHLAPTWQNALLVTDVDDQPLVGAAVYVYHVAQNGIQDAGAKYFHDRPKFMGNTDEDGRYIFPRETDKDWDDPETDEFEGKISAWNPFAAAKEDTAFTPNVWEVEGLLLLKVVSGDRTEFHWLDLTDFNIAYFTNKVKGEYPIRTSLPPSKGVTPLVRPEIPEAIRERNLRPVAVVEQDKEFTVQVGEEFVLNGSKSYDPEGQPFVYAEWRLREGHGEPRDVTGLVYKGKATEPGTLKYVFYVNDGLRVSEGVWITVKAVGSDDD